MFYYFGFIESDAINNQMSIWRDPWKLQATDVCIDAASFNFDDATFPSDFLGLARLRLVHKSGKFECNLTAGQTSSYW